MNHRLDTPENFHQIQTVGAYYIPATCLSFLRFNPPKEGPLFNQNSRVIKGFQVSGKIFNIEFNARWFSRRDQTLSPILGGRHFSLWFRVTFSLTIYNWLFQLDDSKSLLGKWLFHQTSIKKWLFRVPGSAWGFQVVLAFFAVYFLCVHCRPPNFLCVQLTTPKIWYGFPSQFLGYEEMNGNIEPQVMQLWMLRFRWFSGFIPGERSRLDIQKSPVVLKPEIPNFQLCIIFYRWIFFCRSNLDDVNFPEFNY